MRVGPSHRSMLLACLAATVCTFVTQPWGAAPGSAVMAEEIDVRPRQVQMIPPGTRVGSEIPRGWTHVAFILNRSVERGDVKDVPNIAVRMASEFRIMALAKVVRDRSGDGTEYRLDRVGLGFTKFLDGANHVVSSKDEDSSDRIGFIKTRVLATYEKSASGKELRQVIRTPTMIVFDNDAIVLDNQNHRKMVLRHALVVSPKTGTLNTAIWLVKPGSQDSYDMPRPYLWVLPKDQVTHQVINVKANRFSLAGLPKPDAFAVVDYPNALKLQCPLRVRAIASTRTFNVRVARQLETDLQKILPAP